MLTKAEQDAMKWLESVIGSPVDWNGERQHARTIRGMVRGPILPEELSYEMVCAFFGNPEPGEWAAKALRRGWPRLRAHLTKTKPRVPA